MSNANGNQTRRLALSRAEAAWALGVSIDYLDEHVLPEVRIVRRGRRKIIPVSETRALAPCQRRARAGRSSEVMLTAKRHETPAKERMRARCAPAATLPPQSQWAGTASTAPPRHQEVES